MEFLANASLFTSKPKFMRYLIAIGHIRCMENRTIIEAVIHNCSKSSVFAEFDGLQRYAAVE